MKLKPLGDRLIVQAIEEEQTTASGLVLPDTAKEKPQKGKIVAIGDGKLDLLFTNGWISQVEQLWESPALRRMFERMAVFSRLILLDRRGKFATGGFSQSLTTEFGAKASNRSLFVDCDRHATTFHISE